MTFTQLARRVREHLGQEHRYAHSVRVARYAELLAKRHGVVPITRNYIEREEARLRGAERGARPRLQSAG